MTSSRIALYAAVAAAVSWTAKAVAIGAAGGLGESPIEGPLFFTGLLFVLVATAGLGVALTRGRPTWLRALTGVLSAVGLTLVSVLVADGLVDVFVEPGPQRHWAWSEMSLWVVAALMVAATVGMQRRAWTV